MCEFNDEETPEKKINLSTRIHGYPGSLPDFATFFGRFLGVFSLGYHFYRLMTWSGGLAQTRPATTNKACVTSGLLPANLLTQISCEGAAPWRDLTLPGDIHW